MRAIVVVLAAFLCLSTPTLQASPPSSRYFVILYSLENWRNAAAFSHTFAAFYRVDSNYVVYRADISWLPQPQYMPGFRPLRMPAFGSFPGENLSVEETIRRGLFAERTVRSFGPFESSAALFELAVAREAQLQSGAVEYHGLDYFTRPNAVNCVHAVSDIVGIFHTGLRRGPTASYGVAEHFLERGYLFDLTPRTEWLAFLEQAPR